MRRIIPFFLILILIAEVNSDKIIANVNSFCCKDHTEQEKCWGTGQCCGGYWYTSCRDFEIYVKGTNTFRVGEKTSIVLYIKNTGYYTDSYDITYEIISDNPELIQVDMTDANQIKDLSEGQIKSVYPKVTVLSSTVTGTLRFTGKSTGGNQKSTDLMIMESENYLSLPEISTTTFIQLLIVSWVFYYFLSRKQKI